MMKTALLQKRQPARFRGDGCEADSSLRRDPSISFRRRRRIFSGPQNFWNVFGITLIFTSGVQSVLSRGSNPAAIGVDAKNGFRSFQGAARIKVYCSLDGSDGTNEVARIHPQSIGKINFLQNRARLAAAAGGGPTPHALCGRGPPRNPPKIWST